MSIITTNTLKSEKPQRHGDAETMRSSSQLMLISMEVRKMKGSSFWWMIIGMITLVSLWSGFALMKRAGGNPATRTLTLTQGDIYQTISLLAPILAALLTSRLAIMETSERMDLKWQSLGQGETGRFFAKLTVAGIALSQIFMIPLTWTPLAALAMGFKSDGDLSSLILASDLIAFLSSFAVAAIHLMLSATINKQSIGLGISVIAGLVGSGLGPMNIARLGWFFPAGISSAASPFLTTATPDGYARMALATNSWILVLTSLIACISWTSISAFVITVGESHR
nr:ABC transporter permease [Bifidobacterium indicum]